MGQAEDDLHVDNGAFSISKGVVDLILLEDINAFMPSSLNDEFSYLEIFPSTVSYARTLLSRHTSRGPFYLAKGKP